MEELEITPAAINDVPSLEALINSAYRGESSKRGWTTEADYLDGIRTDQEALSDLIGRKDAVILKATNKNGELMGCVFLQKKGDQLYLGMLTVRPTMQDRGIGKQLLKASEDYAIANGCRSIAMTVISIRSELIAWYERKGYKQTGQKEPFPTDPRFGKPKRRLEFIVMEKVLW
ncbi:MAG: GNAT family N-acetyltransferase [Flavisolibacter sp.]|nr:GNAT family N-acetyltransferase [Flavisolibacter sp.]